MHTMSGEIVVMHIICFHHTKIHYDRLLNQLDMKNNSVPQG
jgi:hypothetical protein